VAKLEGQNQQIRVEIESLRAELDVATDSNNTISIELEKKRGLLIKLTLEVDELESVCRSLETKLSLAEKETRNLRDAIVALRAQIETLRQIIHDLRLYSAGHEAETEVARLQEQIRILKADLALARKES
jgi:chromosome segregation ATPase